ncbi:hypothetical protein DYB32_003288 [Aphanomyces invadans]|uniref:Tc1-like transposase DDE domain-containing protein n=1 Tax=Aphanomyces invadans TaxID=157072 RepID=A0A418B0Y3_9STRA|nr:hypothetical protein DYB32_003288 [Aphanomyces invadans]
MNLVPIKMNQKGAQNCAVTTPTNEITFIFVCLRMKKSKGPTADEKQRVLDAHLRGDDWSLVAQHNGMSYATAWRVVNSGRTMLLPRGGVRTGQKKVTAEIRDALEKYLDENCQYTLREMKSFIEGDFNGTNISVQTISRHILGMLYTRREFALKLKQHQINGDFIVYYDETNFNLYCKRSFRRAKKGKRATVVLPPSKGPNLQVQCAVSAEQGLVCYKLERGSIKMEQNAEFFEICTSRVFKARVKSYLVLHTDAMLERGEYGTFLERRMILLEDAAQESISLLELVARNRGKMVYSSQLIAAKYGQILYFTPPYHPKLQPIELVWGMVKNRVALRPSKNVAELEERLWTLFGEMNSA